MIQGNLGQGETGPNRESMTDGAPFPVRGNHHDISYPLEILFQAAQTLCVYSVIVGKEYECHRLEKQNGRDEWI